MAGKKGNNMVRESFFQSSGAEFHVRRGTFKNWQYSGKHDICHPLFMALQWWRATSNRDVECLICQKNLEDWEPTDDPYLEHAKHSPHCAVVAISKFAEHSIGNEQLEKKWSAGGSDLEQAFVDWLKAIHGDDENRKRELAMEVEPPATVRKPPVRDAKKAGAALKLRVADAIDADTLKEAPATIKKPSRKQAAPLTSNEVCIQLDKIYHKLISEGGDPEWESAADLRRLKERIATGGIQAELT